jgi:hypothetical protein
MGKVLAGAILGGVFAVATPASAQLAEESNVKLNAQRPSGRIARTGGFIDK